MKLVVILSSTRDARFGSKVAPWVLETAKSIEAFSEVELIDVKDFELPLFNEVAGPKYLGGNYANAPKAKDFAAKIGEADAFILIHTEHNHGVPGDVSNALAYVYEEWNKKPIGFVGYGGALGGGRATEQLRGIVAKLELVDIQHATNLIFAPFGAWGENGPLDEKITEHLVAELDQLAWYGQALKAGRDAQVEATS
jgi:NAD(P)H-dependent FMN reductase